MYLRDKNEILVFKWSEMVSLPVGDLIPLIGLKDKICVQDRRIFKIVFVDVFFYSNSIR